MSCFWKRTTVILKPSIGRLPNGIDLAHSVENEYLCLKLLESFGIPAAKARITQFGESPVLIVQRFDRLWTEDERLLRIPQEDCCKALSVPPTLKYQSDGGPGIESILRLLRDGDNPAEDQRTLMKTMIVFWLVGATDGHAKNFSVFVSPGGRYRMTPLYDVISAQPSVDASEIRPNQFRLAMSVGDNRQYRINTIAPRHFPRMARHAGIGEQIVSSIFEELSDTTINAARNTVAQLPKHFPEEVATAIQLGIGRRLQAFRRSIIGRKFGEFYGGVRDAWETSALPLGGARSRMVQGMGLEFTTSAVTAKRKRVTNRKQGQRTTPLAP